MAHATTANVPALSHLVRRRTDAFARWVARARAGDVRGVHQARVASRRLREALPLLGVADAEDAAAVLRDLRRLTRALGPVREMDVARALIQELARRHGWPPALTTRLDRYCERLRDRRLEALVDRIDRLDAAGVPARVGAVLAAMDADGGRPPATGIVAPRVRRRARSLVRAIDRAGTLYAATPLHDVRLATKKLRYLLELGAAGAGAPLTQALRPLKTLQALLGDIHDLQIVQICLQEAAAAGRSDRLTERRFAQMDQDIERACRQRHARYLRLVPEVRDLAARAAREATIRYGLPRGRVLKMPLPAPRRPAAARRR